MKRTFPLLGIFLFLVSSVPVFAQMPVAAPGALMPAGLEKIGVVAAAKGKVELTTPGQVGRIAESGQPIFMGDEVKTDSQGHLQILLLDQTVFTIGPNSAIVIDKFVYDPKTSEGEIRASISKGIFRYVSGKIAAKKPDNVSIKLPTATLGFRGTIVVGQVNPDGSAVAGLMGPGANNNAGEQTGSFIVQGLGNNAGGGQEVNRTGFGVEVGSDGSVSGVFQFSTDQINNLTNGLLPGGGGNDSGGQPGGNDGGTGDGFGGGAGLGSGGSVTDLSGQGMVLTGENAGDSEILSGFLDIINDTSEEAAQGAADSSVEILDGITTMEQLAQITTGKYYYYGSGPFFYSDPAYLNMTMEAQCEIDFGARTVGGPDSWVKILDSSGAVFDKTAGSGPDQPIPFGSSGPAVFHWSDVDGVSGGTFKNINVTLRNANGVVAESAAVAVNYTNGARVGAGIAEGGRSSTPVPSGGGTIGPY